MTSRLRPLWIGTAIVVASVASSCDDGNDDTSEQATTTEQASAPSSSSSSDDFTSSVAASSTTAPSQPPPSVALGAPSWSAVYGFGGVWVQVDPPVDQIVKVDEASGAVTLTIDAGTAVAVADDAVWVTIGGEETRKIDPFTGEVLLVVATPDAYYVAVGAGAVWVPSADGVSRLDPVTGATTAIALDLGVTDLQASDDAVWVTHKDEGMVSRIDTATNAVVATIQTDAGAHDLAIDQHGVWITNYQANTVSRIDPVTNTVVATIEGVGSGVGITTGNGAIFASRRDGVIFRIDPASNGADALLTVDGWPYGLAYGAEELWATNAHGGAVYRIDDLPL